MYQIYQNISEAEY